MKKLRPFTEADVTDESAFFMQRRQVLKALGISAAALSFPLFSIRFSPATHPVWGSVKQVMISFIDAALSIVLASVKMVYEVLT